MSQTLTRADLTESIYREVGLSLADSAELLNSIFEEVSKCLENEETVKISSFGTFKIRKKKQRVGRNPKTGVEVPINPRKVVTFHVSNIIKNRINNRQKRSAAA